MERLGYEYHSSEEGVWGREGGKPRKVGGTVREWGSLQGLGDGGGIRLDWARIFYLIFICTFEKI